MAKTRSKFPAVCLLLIFASFLISRAAAEEESTDAPPPVVEEKQTNVGTTSPAEEAVTRTRSQFPYLRMTEDDFKLNAGWELPLTVPVVESFFAKPLELPVKSAAWADRVEKAATTSELFFVASEILGGPKVGEKLNGASGTEPPDAVPPGLKSPITRLLDGMAAARPHLDAAVKSVSKDTRALFLSLNDWPDENSGVIIQEISSRRAKKGYDDMKGFKQTELLKAGQAVFAALDDALPKLKTLNLKLAKPVRFKTPDGDVVINGPENNVYDEADLKDVCLLVDLGGDNTYKSAAAAAHAGEIRIVIDLGANVKIEGENQIRGNAGSGIFGIGVMALVNPRGVKEIRTTDFSQGAGVGGIGAFLVTGAGRYMAERNVQGTGIFGVGIFSNVEAAKSTATATRFGQGAAFVRGVGIYQHRGDDAVIEGGLVQPDPREPLGSVSMCQGVGFGPRAYTGGGVGLASVSGDRVTVRGSYFSQGCGYWHGLGVFRFRGNKSTLQARRYDMGTGVHSAFGNFDVRGNGNRILNWGVGPAYGWDHSVGSAVIEGDDNELQVAWGAGTAAIGSLSFSRIHANRGKFKLCDFASANHFNDEFSFAVQTIDGTDNELACRGQAETGGEPRRLHPTPWGILHVTGVTLNESLKLEAPVWPEPERKEAVSREMADLKGRVDAAAIKPPLEQVADLVDVAAAFSLDKDTPRMATEKLLSLEMENVPFLIDVIEPAAVDQLIRLNAIVPAYGNVAARAMVDRFASASLQKRGLLINLLRYHRPSFVFPQMFVWIKDPAFERLKPSMVRSLSSMLNRTVGDEPGSMACLEALKNYLGKPGDKRYRSEAMKLIVRLRVAEAYALMATVGELTDDDRSEFFAATGPDITAPIDENPAKTILHIVLKDRKKNYRRAEQELTVLAQGTPTVRQSLFELINSTRSAVVSSAVTALGQIADPADVEKVDGMLTHKSADVREAAAVALARFGKPALPAIQKNLKEGNLQTKLVVLAGFTESGAQETFDALEIALEDESPDVRLAALTSIRLIPEQFKEKREKLKSLAQKILSEEEDPDAALALDLLKS